MDRRNRDPDQVVPTNPTHISIAGLELLKRFEGLSLVPYRDPAGLWTVGYGHLLGQQNTLETDRITEQTAESLLREDVRHAEAAIRKLVTAKLHQNQFDALVSFVYNVGAGAFEESTLLRKLNSDDLVGASEEFHRWNKATVDGKLQEIAGLTNRRRTERELFVSS